MFPSPRSVCRHRRPCPDRPAYDSYTGIKCVAVLVAKRVIQKSLFRCSRRTGKPPIRALLQRGGMGNRCGAYDEKGIFISTRLRGNDCASFRQASNSKAAKHPEQECEKKHIPHLGSDTDEDNVTPAKSRRVCQPTAKRKKEVEYLNSDYDYESIFTNMVQCVFSRRMDSLSILDSVLVVTLVPLQYFKEIIPQEVHKVEELTTRYLPPLEKGTELGNILYSVGRHEKGNRDWCYRFDDSEKLFPTRLPRFNTKVIQGMLRKQPYDKARNALALALSPVVRAVVDPDGALQDIRNLDDSEGGTRASIQRMWDPVAYALGFIDCDNISARCMLTIFALFATKTEASLLRMALHNSLDDHMPS
ncbi:hypothetical protein M5K25_003750 [Dendrobium thyrsiflorum]|uniref:Uncharacterized protein n=1 Tax=Dendrobium thyrsiflorum TaxID=117978 RepID=A0ABD0VSK4_DENTH